MPSLALRTPDYRPHLTYWEGKNTGDIFLGPHLLQQGTEQPLPGQEGPGNTQAAGEELGRVEAEQE